MDKPLVLDSSVLPLHDFLCRCGCGELPTDELILVTNRIAADSGIKFQVVSGKRCEAHNVAVKGAKHSQHVLGRACDVTYSDALLTFLLPRLETYKICLEDPLVTKKGLWIHWDLKSRNGYRVFKL